MSVIKEYVVVAEHNYDTTSLLEQVSHIEFCFFLE